MGGHAILCAALLMPLAGEPEVQARSNVRLRDKAARDLVARALDSAAARFARPRCAALLDEFQAQDGRSLRDHLSALGISAPQQVNRVLFYDGDLEPACRRREVIATTTPGGRVVRVCYGFSRRFRREPAYVEAVLIHEVLHTLGLGENPPSSRQITGQVLRACMED